MLLSIIYFEAVKRHIPKHFSHDGQQLNFIRNTSIFLSPSSTIIINFNGKLIEVKTPTEAIETIVKELGY